MKRIATVILISVFIIGCFVVPSFSTSSNNIDFSNQPISNDLANPTYLSKYDNNGSIINYYVYSSNDDTYCFVIYRGSSICIAFASETNATVAYRGIPGSWATVSLSYFDDTNNLYYTWTSYFSGFSDFQVPLYGDITSGLNDIRDHIDNGSGSSYVKNPNVDAFLANTLISMGIKFESASDALLVGAAAWSYCTDENNLTDGDRLNKHDWDIDAFENIVNAHSNFYLNWYKGYKVNENVCLALSWYLYDNFESSAGLSQPRAGTLSGVSVTRDAQYGYKGITNAATNYNMQSSYTFYSGSTLTYVNGSFVSETNLINGSQFLYEPSEVRRFIAFPPASVDNTSPDPNATGTLTNGDTTYDIDIQFPSLDWLKDLIIALIDAVTNLFTTIADFLSQILDAILGLFSDAFAGLEEFGAGIVDWITALFTGLSSLISCYLPNDIAAIIVAFISLNIGVGLIKFVLGKV